MNDIFAIVLGYYLQRHGLEERLTYDNYLLSVVKGEVKWKDT